jgi:hypothetical protein
MRRLSAFDHRCQSCGCALHWSEGDACDRCERAFEARERRWERAQGDPGPECPDCRKSATACECGGEDDGSALEAA